MTKKEFVAIDGDDVGLQLRSGIIANDVEATSILSLAIIEHFDALATTLKGIGYQIVFCGGDSLLAWHPNSPNDTWIKELPDGPCTISIGIGTTMEHAYLALQLAKARGKNQVVRLSSTVADTIYEWEKNKVF